MVEILLGSEFVAVWLLVIVSVTAWGFIKIKNGARNFSAVLSEFARWSPAEQTPETYREYQRSVLEFAQRSSLKSCGMWSTFLDNVSVTTASTGEGEAECSGEALDTLRDNLLFAYTTSDRVPRLNGQAISGIGFAGTLIVIAAAAIASQPFLNGSAQIEQALFTLLSGGGAAFAFSIAGIFGSILFNILEKQQAELIEREIDELMSSLRRKVVCRTEKHYLAEIREQMSHSSYEMQNVIREIGDRVQDLRDNQLTREHLDGGNRQLSAELSGAVESGASRIVDALSMQHSEAQSAREEQRGVLYEISQNQQSQSASMERWWQDTLDVLKVQVEQFERQNSSLDSIDARLRESATREEQIVRLLENIQEAVEGLDEALEEDIDHLIEESRENQTVLMHYLNDSIESHLNAIAERMQVSEEHSDRRAQEFQEALERVSESVREAVNEHRGSAEEYIGSVKRALSAGLSELRGAIDRNTEDRLESNTRLLHMLEESNRTSRNFAQDFQRYEEERRSREVIRDARDRKYWEQQLRLAEEENDIDRRILAEQERAFAEQRERSLREERSYLDRLNRLKEGRFDVDLGDEVGSQQVEPESRAQGGVELSGLRRSVGAARSAISAAVKSFEIVGEQSSYLARTCASVKSDMNKMNTDIIDQTEQRLRRYGKAYQPLSECNLLICELLTRAIKDVGDIKRRVNFDYDRLSLALAQPAERLDGLLESIDQLEDRSLLSDRQVQELESWWSQDDGVKVIEDYVSHLKDDLSASAKVHMQAQEIAGELKKQVTSLKKLLEINILDQVTNWPAVLDEARNARDSSRRLASLEKKLATVVKRSDDAFVQAIEGISATLDRTETLLTNAEGRESHVAR